MQIPAHDNPTLAARILKLRCTGPELCSILCNFASQIQHFVAMTTSLQNSVTVLKSATMTYETFVHVASTLAAKSLNVDRSYCRFCVILALKCKNLLPWQRPFKIW